MLQKKPMSIHASTFALTTVARLLEDRKGHEENFFEPDQPSLFAFKNLPSLSLPALKSFRMSAIVPTIISLPTLSPLYIIRQHCQASDCNNLTWHSVFRSLIWSQASLWSFRLSCATKLSTFPSSPAFITLSSWRHNDTYIHS